MGRRTVIRWGARAAVLAGACWVVKAVGILLTGSQPPAVFERSFVLFPVALVGLYAVLERDGGRLATSGLVVAVGAGLSAVVAGLGAWVGPDRWEPRQDTFTVLTPFISLAGFGTFVALLLLGLAVRRTRALPGRRRTVPLALAVSTVPLMAVGAALEGVSERLLELPVLLLGGAWIALGAVLGQQAGPRTPPPVGSPRQRL